MKYREARSAPVTLEGQTPNREFDFSIEARASRDDGVVMDGPVMWDVRGKDGKKVQRPVKYKALAERLEAQAQEAADAKDWSGEVHEHSMAAWEDACDRRREDAWERRMEDR